MRNSSLIISVIALALSVFSLITVMVNPRMDISSNLIAALGIICTVLVGWQIFALIDFRTYEKKFSELESKLRETRKDINEKYESIQKTNTHMECYQGLLYNEIAKVFLCLSRINSHRGSDYLYEAVRCYLEDFRHEMSKDDTVFLRSILCDIENCAHQKIGLSPGKAEALLWDAMKIVSSSRTGNREVSKVLEELVDLIRDLPVAPDTFS